MTKAHLIFEDGTVFTGQSAGSEGQVIGRVSPYNGMTGYQQFLTDPSCYGDLVCMTYPIIGSVGITHDENSSGHIQAGGLIVREANPKASSSSSEQDFVKWLSVNGCVGICDIDTRDIIHHLKENGQQNAVITTGTDPDIQFLSNLAGLFVREKILDKVSVKRIETFEPDTISRYKICVLDFGTKKQVLNALTSRGCQVVLLPYDTPADSIRGFKPDGIILSGGPVDALFEMAPQIAAIRGLTGNQPILGIGVGHLALAGAYGLAPHKMRLGHHGVNYPVYDCVTGNTFITSQNHHLGFGNDDIPDHNKFKITHININDESVEGFAFDDATFSVQFIPDNKTATNTTGYIWDEYVSKL